MRGRWAEGIPPRDLLWVIKSHLAICERPGGYGSDHRMVRRTEEIIWIKRSEFTCLVSLIPGPHNISHYVKEEVNFLHSPIPSNPTPETLATAYESITSAMAKGEILLMHRDKVDDVMGGFLAGFGLWKGRIKEPPQAVAMVEQILRRPVGGPGREIVAEFAASGLTQRS